MGEESTHGPSDSTRADGISLDSIPLHSTNLLTALDEDGIVRYESPAIERIYGFDQHELVGDPVSEYFHPDDRADVLDAFQSLVDSEDEAVETVEYRHERADGTYCWVESTASSTPTPEGYYVVNTRNISDRKAREQQLKRTNERLETFASVISHDLRNPLNVAQLRLDMAGEECESPHLEDVATAHGRIERLIEDLLTLARNGRDISETEPVDLAALAESSWDAVATGDATLHVSLDEQLDADASRLAQLLENLMRNSIEHAGDDVTVTVGTLENGFYVADDGPGIDLDDRDEVFTSGYSTGEAGTGLGLTIVREIAEAHGWDVGLTRSETGGARFEFTGVSFVA